MKIPSSVNARAMKTTEETWKLCRDLRIAQYESAIARLERLYTADGGTGLFNDEIAEARSLVRRLRNEAARICDLRPSEWGSVARPKEGTR